MMRLPSIIKKPKYQRFHITPRYYDPVKEDIEIRTSRIKQELGLSDQAKITPGYQSQISGSFRKHMKHAKSGGVDQTSMLRLIILVVLVLFVGGFLYIGTEILYLAFLYVPFYLWKRFSK